MLYGFAVQTYKVAVWATGGVGRFAIRTVVDRPTLALVGAWVHSARKDGEDVGTLAGIAPVGVRASRDEAAVLNGDADCVVYAAPAGSRPKEALADLCRADGDELAVEHETEAAGFFHAEYLESVGHAFSHMSDELVRSELARVAG